MTDPTAPQGGVSGACGGSAAGGAAGVVADVLDQAKAALAPAEQLGLFPVPHAERLEAKNAIGEAERQRGAGRPPGAQNKATRELREWLLKSGIVPQHWQVRWLLLEPEQLAARLRCSVAEAFDRQAAIADKLGPYIMAKMAPTDAQGNAVPGLVLQIGGAAVNAGGATVPPWLNAWRFESEQDQGLTIDADPQSQDERSQAEEKA